MDKRGSFGSGCDIEVTRRQLFGGFTSAVLGLGAVALFGLDNVDAAVAPPWHKATQDVRNEWIVIRGTEDIDKIGGSCKEWVRRVVSDASKKSVDIPSSTDDECGWSSSTDVGQDKKRTIYGVRRGEIIQMRWQNAGNKKINPHTAIVYSIGSTSMKWLDSNMVKPSQVGIHTVTFKEFVNQALCYKIYYIK